MAKKVLILGNGISRLLHKGFINDWTGELWGCNRIYTEYGNKLTRVTGHYEECLLALEAKKTNNFNYVVMYGKKTIVPEMIPFSFDKHFQGNSGINLVAQALYEGYEQIYLCGFDIGGPDVHSPDHHLINKQNWVLKWRKLLEHSPEDWDRLIFVGYDHKPYLRSNESPRVYFDNYSQEQPHIPGEAYKKLLEKFFSKGDLMDENKKRANFNTKVIVRLFVVCGFVVVFCAGWFFGSFGAREELSRTIAKYENQLNQTNTDLERTRESLERARIGIDFINRGFEEAIETSKRIEDRAERIAFLVQRITNLIRASQIFVGN